MQRLESRMKMSPPPARILLTALLLGLEFFQPPRALHGESPPEGQTVVLAGGTIIDVSNFGRSADDIRDGLVVIRGSRIAAAGSRNAIRVPEGARIVDVRGKYVVPGLTDGFAALGSQAWANAYLYMGVTSIVGVGGDPRRPPLFLDASPGPRIYRLEDVGFEWDKDDRPREFSEVETARQIDALARTGAKVLWISYPITPELARKIVRQAKRLGLATIGELGVTSYREGVEAGIDAFVHTSRYSLEIAPPEMHRAVADSPFGPSRIEFYNFLNRLDLEDSKLMRYAAFLAASRTALIPTLSLEYLDLPEHENPWKEPAAAILDPKDIHLPANRRTGNREVQTEEAADAFPPGFPRHLLRIEEQYRRAGAKYLTGSGTSAFGTMPGISLHTELQLLTRIGLPSRQALAASTSNFGEIFRWAKVGQVKAGYNADVLVLDANPLEDIRNLKKIRMVILDGRILDREGLLTR
ncbi:MAG TPA: amidohydrolase family protein [Thermoanaerobaculia bacterium]